MRINSMLINANLKNNEIYSNKFQVSFMQQVVKVFLLIFSSLGHICNAKCIKMLPVWLWGMRQADTSAEAEAETEA